MKETKKILWYNLAFMAFSSVWSFSNIINGYAEYGGLKAIVSWLFIFAIYFIPYTLMVGEMGSAFKDSGGGVSAWIKETINPKLAYYAGWTYWVVHLPYISQKPQTIVIAAMWILTGGPDVSKLSPLVLQSICLVVFLLALWISYYGVNILKRISTIAGSSMFVMSILFIIMTLAAPQITGGHFESIDWSLKTFLPKFDAGFFGGLSILVFAVGGCERISPYVNKMDNPAKGFPKGMMFLAIMVVITAVLGTIALGMMFPKNTSSADLMTNGAYYAFQRLGEHYHVGNTFMYLYAITNFIGQASTLIMSIDAPLRILLESTDHKYIPSAMFKQNKHGAYTNARILILVFVSVLIIVPALGLKDVDGLVKWLIKLNSVCMPLRYLWVFVAYIALKKAGNKFHSDYRFTKSKTLGIIMGCWCFGFTAFACISGMITNDPFQLVMNITTPIVLVLLGLIMPVLAKREREKAQA